MYSFIILTVGGVKMIHKNIYSNRMKKTDKVDPYIYEIISPKVQTSFKMLFSKCGEEYLANALLDYCETKREYLSTNIKNYIEFDIPYNKFDCLEDINKLFKSYSTENILDLLDILIAQYIKKIDSINPCNRFEEDDIEEITLEKNVFVNNLNETIEHNNLGYCVINNVIATKESDFLHQEVVSKPLTLLVNEEFNGAAEEFTKAIDNYTKKDYENCVLEACKAFESTIKSILDNRQIEYETTGPNAKLNKYMDKLKAEGLFDSYLDSFSNNLIAILNSSVNTVRNRLAGHGDGSEPKEVERSYASFALNLSGSCIMFLLDKYYEKGGKKS